MSDVRSSFLPGAGSIVTRENRFDASATGVSLVALLGVGIVMALAGAPAGDTRLMVAGGALAAIAAAILMAAGWLEGPLVVALSLPLPALYSTPSLRVAAALPVTALAVGAWILHLGLTGRPIKRGSLPVGPTLALASVFVLATLFAQHPLVSVRETINFSILLLFLVAATDAFAIERGLFARTMRWLVVIAAGAGILAVLEALGTIPGEFPRYNTAFNRAALGFGQPNGLGLFFAILLPFALHEYRFAVSRGARIAFAFTLACLVVGLFATFSRGAWLAILAGAGVLLFTGDARLIARVWFGALVAALLLDVVSGGLIRDTIERSIGDWVIEQRAALMLAGIVMFLAYPLTGVGPGGYAESLEEFGPQIPQLWDYLPTPHNAYVQMAAETGIIGLVVFVIFFAVVLLRQVRTVRSAGREAHLQRTVLWSIGTALAAGLVVWPFAHGTGQAVMLVLAGAFALQGAET